MTHQQGQPTITGIVTTFDIDESDTEARSLADEAHAIGEHLSATDPAVDPDERARLRARMTSLLDDVQALVAGRR